MGDAVNSETIKLLTSRRSAKTAMLADPGPSSEELDTILACAARVPDHRMVEPWRFIVFEGNARERFGEVMAGVLKAEEKEPPSQVRLDTERGRFMTTPVVVAVVSQVKSTPGAPEWEQILSCGAAAQNLCLAANAIGYSTCWLTGWPAFSPGVADALHLGEGERIAGFIHIGTARERQPERKRPALEAIVTRWQG